MKRKTIRWLCLSSLGLCIIGIAAFLVTLGIVQNSCTSAQISAGTCVQAPALIPVFLLFGLAAILLMVAWVGALVRTARMQTWVWFVVVLLAHGLGLLIYALIGPDDQPALSQFGSSEAWSGRAPPATS